MDKDKRFIAADMAECAVFVALMAVAAYVQIPFPLVPLTFQTAISVLAGLLLGAKKGTVSMLVYALLGLLGLPVFSAGGGIYYVLKPSFGYIIGFVASAFTAGIISGGGKSFWRYLTAALAAFLANYVIGIPYCLAAAHLLGVQNLAGLLLSGNLAYMPKDALLSILAAVIAYKAAPVMRKAAHGRPDRG